MEIHWRDDALKKDLQDAEWLLREYDERVARNVARRLLELEKSASYAKLPLHTGKHPIKEGKKFLYYAVDVPGLREGRGKLRLLFRPYGQYDLAHVETICAVVIVGLENYHR